MIGGEATPGVHGAGNGDRMRRIIGDLVHSAFEKPVQLRPARRAARTIERDWRLAGRRIKNEAVAADAVSRLHLGAVRVIA